MWACYRLIDKGWATLAEMEYGDRLNINDVDLANIALNAKEDALVRAHKNRKRR